MKSKDKVLVSIVTVCYNSENTIRDTLESVLRQTYNNIEYIIVDGGSTDLTVQIVEEYREYANTQIRKLTSDEIQKYMSER